MRPPIGGMSLRQWIPHNNHLCIGGFCPTSQLRVRAKDLLWHLRSLRKVICRIWAKLLSTTWCCLETRTLFLWGAQQGLRQQLAGPQPPLQSLALLTWGLEKNSANHLQIRYLLSEEKSECLDKTSVITWPLLSITSAFLEMCFVNIASELSQGIN